MPGCPLQLHHALTLADVVTEAVLDTAYAWLCHQRWNWPANADVWRCRQHWPEEKAQLRADLLAGTYEVGLPEPGHLAERRGSGPLDRTGCRGDQGPGAGPPPASPAVAALSDEELHRDLSTCQRLLTEHLQPQTYWPFCYPYGQKDSFSDLTVKQLKQPGFTCAFSTEVGGNTPGTPIFTIRRFDCNDVPQA